MAGPKYLTRFTVKGDGRFPFDMLRYDSCFPVGPRDVDALLCILTKHFAIADICASMDIRPEQMFQRLTNTRNVTLATYHHTKGETCITPARWKSFGWEVVCIEEPRKL